MIADLLSDGSEVFFSKFPTLRRSVLVIEGGSCGAALVRLYCETVEQAAEFVGARLALANRGLAPVVVEPAVATWEEVLSAVAALNRSCETQGLPNRYLAVRIGS